MECWKREEYCGQRVRRPDILNHPKCGAGISLKLSAELAAGSYDLRGPTASERTDGRLWRGWRENTWKRCESSSPIVYRPRLSGTRLRTSHWHHLPIRNSISSWRNSIGQTSSKQSTE